MSQNLVRLAICVALASIPSYASVAVGTCQPQLTHFTTINAAVTAVPPGTTILVCPGSYPEQVVINKNLTLKGVPFQNNGAAIITAPGGRIAVNSSSLATGGDIAAQILVDGASAVTISNLIVDGSNNGIATCGTDLVGIYYRNSSGTVTRNTVLNQALGSGFTGCQSGLGIFVQSGSPATSTVTLSSNYVQNYQKNGITGNEVGTKVTISGNTVIGQGSTTGAAENSIQIGFGATGTISGNVVGDDIWAPDTSSDPGDAAAGILVFASSGITISANTVNSTQFGIAIAGDPSDGTGDGNTIKTNKIGATHIFDGIDLCSSSNLVTGNSVLGSDEAAIHIDDSCTASNGNSVSGNTLHTACAGLLIGPTAAGNSISPNTFINVSSLTLTAAACAPPLASVPRRARPRVHGFRP